MQELNMISMRNVTKQFDEFFLKSEKMFSKLVKVQS